MINKFFKNKKLVRSVISLYSLINNELKQFPKEDRKFAAIVISKKLCKKFDLKKAA